MRVSAKGYKSAAVCALLLFMLAFMGACDRNSRHKEAVKYHCPMHPTYVADKPGTCPICGMDLVPIEKNRPDPSGKTREPEKSKATSASRTERKILFYRSPMDPSITSPVPAKDEMGMAYVPVYADEAAPPEKKGVKGLATVTLDEKGIRLSGIQVAEAVRRTMSGDVKAAGIIKADETRVRHVHTKSSGWIDKLYVNAAGQAVKAGQRLLTIYSPQFLASQEEFLQARQNAMRFAGSPIAEVRKGGDDMLKAARKRLKLLDIPDSLIQEIEKTGRPQRSVTLLAPVSGFVTLKQVYEGQEVNPEMDLFIITDLSQVWVEADFYEFESHLVNIGQTAVISFPYDSKREITSQIAYVYPYLDSQTRTIRARFILPNSDFSLKPEMYANVLMKIMIPESVVVPDSAVMNTGLRQIVFVETGNGLFEPREVKTGYRGDGFVQVLSGVTASEKVVIRANFLLDSESRLRAAILESAKASGKGAGGSQ